VPNAIEFLEPEKTFETNTNSLQDFIIALDKEKADHLRYKIDGDYVKVYITPYKTTIEESDMEFSHGDYNVDLVVALNVANAGDLDSALTEYGRIMHDASSINIQADVAGNFADLEWGDPNASSVSEMVYRLSDKLREEGEKSLIDKPIATALLAGIVAATNRFSNEHTQPETMAAASKLMMAGADQQLISSSIPVDILTSDVVDANEDAKEPEPESEPESEPEPKPEKAQEQKIEHNKPEKKPEDKKAKEDSADDKKIEEELEDLENIESGTNEEEKKEEPAKEAAPAVDDKPEPIPEVEPEPEKPVDPTALDIRHGAVDFELDENGEEKITVPEPAEEPAPAPEPVAEPAPAPEPEPEPIPEPVMPAVPEAPVAPVMPPVPEAPAAPEMPAASSVIIEPDVSPVLQEKQNHVAEPLSEEDYNAEDHSAENAIDAALQKAAEAARQNEIASAAEAAQATAQLNQMVAANTATQPATPVMQELAQTANGFKNLVPPSEAMQPPKIPKDYSAMMNEALSEPIPAPAPAATPVAAPVESAPMMAPTMPAPMAAPVAAPEAAAAPAPAAPPADVTPVEFENPLPMPDPNGILPPPPVPFTPEANQAAAPAELPTAQAFVEQIQANNPAVQSVPATPAEATPTVPAPVVSEPAVAPIMPAVPEDAPTLSNGGMAASPAVQGVNPVMQDQIYPADPSAFHIPGM